MSKKTWIIIIVAIILLIAGYFIWQNWKNKRRQELLNSTDQGATRVPNATEGGTGSGDAFPLKMGSRGNNVLAAQIAINEGCAQLSDKIAEDGVFGPQTEAAADICFGNMNGHRRGEISYAEFQSLRKAIGSKEELRIKEGCTASAASRLMMKTVYGIDCDKMGYGSTFGSLGGAGSSL